MNEVFRLVYTSVNRLVGSEQDIARNVADILAASKRNNGKAGVTGALMFNGGVFAQVLEGPRKAVEATFERIQRDDRHGEVTVLQCAPAAERSFPNWSMAFVGHSEAGRALWDKLAGQSGFNPSKLGGDEVYAVLRRILVEEEKAPVREAPAPGALDPDRLRAELPSVGRPPRGHASPEPKASCEAKPASDPELGVLRASLAEERRRTTELRERLDETHVALAKGRAEMEQVQNECRAWAHRVRLLAEALGKEATASLKGMESERKPDAAGPNRRVG